jgi:hypothetical protein
MIAGDRLRLGEAEDDPAVGVRQVVGYADLVQAIGAVADVDPGQPLAGASARLAVAEVEQTGFKRPVVGPAAGVELAAGGAGLKRGVANGTGHGRFSPCAISMQ